MRQRHRCIAETFQAIRCDYRILSLIVARPTAARQTARRAQGFPPAVRMVNAPFPREQHPVGHVMFYNGLSVRVTETRDTSTKTITPPLSHRPTPITPPKAQCTQASSPHLLNPLVESLQPGVLNPNDILRRYFLAQDRSLRTASLQCRGADTGGS